MPFELTSPAFDAGEPIPRQYTCDGEDISPPLQWSDPPQGTRSFVLISDDPDAPAGTWVHWVLYNLPDTVLDLTAGASKEQLVRAMEGHILAQAEVMGTYARR
jgi:phosphatidylethanolamine-binding protein (PEBP) family uncharacterized protein